MFHKNKIIFTLLILILLSLIFYRLLENNLASLEGLTGKPFINPSLSKLTKYNIILQHLNKIHEKNTKTLELMISGPTSIKNLTTSLPKMYKNLQDTLKSVNKNNLN
jgi:hypothetical protein